MASRHSSSSWSISWRISCFCASDAPPAHEGTTPAATTNATAMAKPGLRRRKRMGLNATFDEPCIRVHGSTAMGFWSNGILMKDVTKGFGAEFATLIRPYAWTHSQREKLDPGKSRPKVCPLTMSERGSNKDAFACRCQRICCRLDCRLECARP